MVVMRFCFQTGSHESPRLGILASKKTGVMSDKNL
jgi:hypothetical protein